MRYNEPMRIGIDISQIVFEGTGVAKYVREMVRGMVEAGSSHEFVLFGASLRKQQVFQEFYASLPSRQTVTLRIYPIPPTVLSILWNTLHILPVEWLIGPVDIFWSSDWTQPPLSRAKGVTTIHDLIALKFPEQTHNTVGFDSKKLRIAPNIVSTHAARIKRVLASCDMIFCDSEATKNDCRTLLGVDEKKLTVVYPGYSI